MNIAVLSLEMTRENSEFEFVICNFIKDRSQTSSEVLMMLIGALSGGTLRPRPEKLARERGSIGHCTAHDVFITEIKIQFCDMNLYLDRVHWAISTNSQNLYRCEK